MHHNKTNKHSGPIFSQNEGPCDITLYHVSKYKKYNKIINKLESKKHKTKDSFKVDKKLKKIKSKQKIVW